jgi:predicted ATPase
MEGLSYWQKVGFSFYWRREPAPAVAGLFAGKQLLLILDNFEHLIGSGARGLIGEMLSAAPSVKLLVTSRAQLNIQVEQLYPVGGMYTAEIWEASKWDNPEEQAKSFCAVQLFLERARCAAGLCADERKWTSALEICQLVQGCHWGGAGCSVGGTVAPR